MLAQLLFQKLLPLSVLDPHPSPSWAVRLSCPLGICLILLIPPPSPQVIFLPSSLPPLLPSFLLPFLPSCHVARGILVPRPGIEPGVPAVRALGGSPNHWTIREVPVHVFFNLWSMQFASFVVRRGTIHNIITMSSWLQEKGILGERKAQFGTSWAVLWLGL